MTERYDVIIIGSGAAGCGLARHRAPSTSATAQDVPAPPA